MPLLLLAFAASSAQAHQDDVLLPLPASTALFSDAQGWLTHSDGQSDLAVYPFRGSGHHRWHGRVRGDVAIAQPSEVSLVRLGLSVQTVADDRNEIAFRLTRVYYDAFTGYEHRLGADVVYAGYRHRCSHGADTAVDGRVLIRSGPELGYRLERRFGDLELAAHAFTHASLIAQNDDVASLPRALLGAAVELRLHDGRVSYFAAAGGGLALLSRSQDWTATLFDPIADLRARPLPALSLGVTLRGVAAAFRVAAHFQRILDTGVGQSSAPQDLLSLQLGLLY